MSGKSDIASAIATAAQWLSIAIIVCAVATCSFLSDNKTKDVKLACFQAGAHWDSWSGTCAK